MKYLFTPEGQQALTEFMAQSPLLGFDFDGTLAPIVDAPEQAAMRGIGFPEFCAWMVRDASCNR